MTACNMRRRNSSTTTLAATTNWSISRRRSPRPRPAYSRSCIQMSLQPTSSHVRAYILCVLPHFGLHPKGLFVNDGQQGLSGDLSGEVDLGHSDIDFSVSLFFLN